MKPILWREAFAESDLDKIAKLVAYALSTRMNGAGDTFAGKADIARRASLSLRAVDEAIKRLERAGYLVVVRSRGRRPNHYLAADPNPAPAAGLDGSTPHLTQTTPHLTTTNPAGAAPELDLKANESVRPSETEEERKARAVELRKTLREHQLLRSIPQ